MPDLWLLSDERNDAVLEDALRKLPRGSGFIYRHYHLSPAERRRRFEGLVRIARARGHTVIVAGSALGRDVDGSYGNLQAPRASLRIATAHSLRQIARANRAGADAVLLSPVFPTRTHPEGKTLGPVRFRLMAKRAAAPVIALGGMNRRTARRLCWGRWAAIDGLSASR